MARRPHPSPEMPCVSVTLTGPALKQKLSEEPKPPKRKVYSYPLTQEILSAYMAAGFTEVLLRNPLTGEEAAMLPPEIKNGLCGTCGQKLSEPRGPYSK